MPTQILPQTNINTFPNCEIIYRWNIKGSHGRYTYGFYLNNILYLLHVEFISVDNSYPSKIYITSKKLYVNVKYLFMNALRRKSEFNRMFYLAGKNNHEFMKDNIVIHGKISNYIKKLILASDAKNNTKNNTKNSCCRILKVNILILFIYAIMLMILNYI